MVHLADEDSSSCSEREYRLAIKFAARVDLHHLCEFIAIELKEGLKGAGDAGGAHSALLRRRGTHLEAHYSDILTAFDNPLDHLDRFPYYENYVNLSKLEHGFLARHAAAPGRVAFIGSGPLPFSSLFLATNHLRGTRFDNYDRCGASNDRARRLVAAAEEDVRARMAFHTADVADLTAEELGAYDVLFLAALVGMASEEKAEAIAHLGKRMADGAALVVRSAHGARAFLYPVVELDDIRRGGFEVLAVYYPTGDEVFNSFIVARKVEISGTK
ncbi:hypothetical protein ACQ4PT_053304 [Festuca glaucescens]